jgi:hypothetical protein
LNYLNKIVVPPLAIVCHDAGAANLIASWIKTYTAGMKVCMVGPARTIWRRNFPEHELLSLEEVLLDSNTLLSGTGWGDVEFEARVIAKKNKIKNIAVIDHWVNYSERFIRDGNKLLPNLILVSDKYAFKKASNCFPSTQIEQLPNTYLQDEANLVSSIRTIENKKSSFENILIIGETTRRKNSNKENIAIEFLMMNLNKINNSRDNINITLRCHPSYSHSKYDSLINKYKYLVNKFIISKDKELYEEIALADLVVGMNSFALVVSLTAGVPTMSILPPGFDNLSLPYDQIIKLRDL